MPQLVEAPVTIDDHKTRAVGNTRPAEVWVNAGFLEAAKFTRPLRIVDPYAKDF